MIFIRKIKKEAVDKLIAELIVNNNEGSTQFPELLEEKNRTLIEQWWEAILDAIRSMYNSSNINIFENVASRILTEDIGTVSDINSRGIFLQVANEAVDNFYNTIIDRDGRLELIPELNGKKRHYVFDGEKEIAQTVSEKVKKNLNFPDRTDIQKIQDNQKREWGSEGHSYLETFVTNSLIDENGYAKKLSPVKISTRILPEIKEALEVFAIELINSYKPGTRFIIEKKVVNEKVKGKVASTIDFIAIEPDDKTGMKVDILDWKFTSINKDKDDDIPWYKQKEWKPQMGEYSTMMYNYGLKSNQIRKARMIPFINNYDEINNKQVLTSIEIGKLDSLQETTLYLLPVPLDTELTGNSEIDQLIKSLRIHYNKLFKSPISPQEKNVKDIQMNELSKAIRQLHLRFDFEPLAAVGETFLNNAAKILKEFKNIEYSLLTKEEIQAKLGNLLSLQTSALKFSTLDKVFLSKFPTKELLPEDRKTLLSLDRISSATERMLPKIVSLQNQFAIQFAALSGITLETIDTTDDNVKLKAEREIKSLARTFMEGTKLPNKIINIASNFLLNSKNTASIEVGKIIDKYSPLLIELEKEARAIGKSAFDMIGEVRNGKLSLIRKINKVFFEEMSVAKDKQNKKFFIKNMDVDKYTELSNELIEKGTKEINETTFSTEEDENNDQKEYRIKKLKDSLDIKRSSFNGYKGYQFNRLFRETLKEEKHISQEFINMSKNKHSLAMWEFLTSLNKRAYENGYLSQEGMSFFPLLEATILEKISATDNILSESKDFFNDLYTMRINDEPSYSKIDEETNELKREIPKLFTRTNKEVHQLSRDMNKVGTLWIKALVDYETSKEMENTLLTLQKVEEARGHISEENGNIIFEQGAPKVDFSKDTNPQILKTIIDDGVYRITENISSIGNTYISAFSDKFNKTEEGKQKSALSIKKGLENSNILVRALAVGLKPLIAIANYFGVNFHAYINAGNMYNFIGDYQKNQGKILSGINFSTIERALMDKIIPLNDDVTTEKRREIAKKQGYIKYLSTWNFNDVMMSTNSIPERLLGLTNALSFIDNSMVVNGEIVNIRQYIKRQDYSKTKSLTFLERKQLEKTYEARVKELKESSSLTKIAKIENDELIIPNVSNEELGKFRTKIIEYGRKLSGQMNRDNKADFARDSILKSFMMFKTWIPKHIISRTSDIQKNLELDEWEYGRARLFVKTWAYLGFKNILKMQDIIQGTDEGLRIMNEILEQKKEEYYLKTGLTLEITEEEFYELMRRELSNQMKELGLLLGIMSLVIAAKAAEPPEDSDPLTRNKYNWLLKMTNKISDELSFYYNPISFESITRGSVMPALSLLSKTYKIVDHVSKETYGTISGDEEMTEGAHPLKYFLNIVPVGSQFQNEILPYIDPALAKALGVRVSAESRPGR